MSISKTASLVGLAEKEGFTQGVAWAISVCRRSGTHDGAATFLLHQAGLSTADFVEARVDEYDLTPVCELIAETETASVT